ncbi:MAG: DUF3769 domain-containing protein, partial [Synechococcaceae cyanobacterium]|nr:DUF3769 domain-containing protein [Synechococcaceae cyanobacterium]
MLAERPALARPEAGSPALPPIRAPRPLRPQSSLPEALPEAGADPTGAPADPEPAADLPPDAPPLLPEDDTGPADPLPGPVLPAVPPAAADEGPAPTAPVSGHALPVPGEPPPLELELTSNRQEYDGQLRRFVSTGNVSLRVAGGRLLADRVEYDPETRTLHAFGSVRYQRGQQYLQAGRLRYSLLEGTGEMEDVYGILDLDTSEQDLDLESMPSAPLPPPEPISCTPEVPPPPDWYPHPWAVTAWGGRMFHSDFGETFQFKGVLRPEYLMGLGAQRRILQAGPFALELDINWLNHWASPQTGGRYTGPLNSAEVAELSTEGQYFGEFTAGVMLRAWLQPWLSIGFEE